MRMAGLDSLEGSVSKIYMTLESTFDDYDVSVRFVVIGALKEHHVLNVKARRLKAALDQRLVPETNRTEAWVRHWELNQKRHEIFLLLDLSMDKNIRCLHDVGFFDLCLGVITDGFAARIRDYFEFVLDVQRRCVEERRCILSGARRKLAVIENLCSLRLFVRALCGFRRSRRNAKPCPLVSVWDS